MKIALCVPHNRDVHARFMECLVALVQYSSKVEIVFNGEPTTLDIQLFMEAGSILAYQRNKLAFRANDWGANYLLWMDSDHSFPPHALIRLLSLNLPIVGLNQARRGYPTYPTALGLDGELLWTTAELAASGAVEEVERLGLAFCLMDMSILGSLHEAALARGQKTLWPLFGYEVVPDSLRVIGEDSYLFRLLKQAGIKTYVDHALSWDVGHLHEVALTNADTVADKEAYQASLASQ